MQYGPKCVKIKSTNKAPLYQGERHEKKQRSIINNQQENQSVEIRPKYKTNIRGLEDMDSSYNFNVAKNLKKNIN